MVFYRFIVIVFLIHDSAYGQNNPFIQRTIAVNQNTVSIRYQIISDSLNGFYSVNEKFSGNGKLMSAKCKCPYKWKNNVLSFSCDRLLLNSIVQFEFEKINSGTVINGNLTFENYPDSLITFNFDEFLINNVQHLVDEKSTVTTTHSVNSNTEIRFRVQLAASTSRIDITKLMRLTGLNYQIIEDQIDGYYKYTIGNELTESDAQSILNRLNKPNFKGPFIVAYKGNIRVPIKQALFELKQ